MRRLADESGLTLVELLMTVAVTGVIVSFLATSIYQTITVTGYGNNRLTALHELQNAAYWFNLDGQKALSAEITPGLVLTLSETNTITYELAGTELRRTTAGSQITLAQNITSAEFSLDGRIIVMSLTSAPEGREDVSESGSYQVNLRPSEAP